MERLRRSNITSLKDLLNLPKPIQQFKRRLGHMGRLWYKDYEVPKDVKMSNEQLGYGWFQDTVTENLFLCCRLIKDNENPYFYLNLNPKLIETTRKTNAELKT